MCPMVPISVILAFLVALIELTSAKQARLSFENKSLEVFDGQSINVSFWAHGILAKDLDSLTCVVNSSAETSAIVRNCQLLSESWDSNGTVKGQFSLESDLLGYAGVNVQVKSEDIITEEQMEVKVKLHKTVIQHVFIGSIVLLVSLNYVNMGCALDMTVIRATLKKPIGPIVGLTAQYLLMPLLSYFSATYLMTEPYLQLGLFTFGCSPGGGASNMWTVLLGGNLDLSVTMTFVSTVLSLAFMPLWLFTLGKRFFKETSPKIPFTSILGGLVGMVIPLGLGLVMQRYCPKGTAFCRRILAPFSILMIVFIIFFGTYANIYMFRLMTWEIALAAIANVWLGFLLGFVVSLIFGRTWKDSITIMVETGIQNTGVAIVLLGVSLPKPEGDMAAVVPVAASSITPIPLTIIWLVLKFMRCSPATDKVSDRQDVKFEPIKRYEAV